ncbi:MAG: hypothetical protein BGO28_02095 [Alphaproteobacteria bacterium 43-37]|nr:MAG: hypothetical protein BGO28_02095 [Alphaproteobacteria bacterium 43-37]
MNLVIVTLILATSGCTTSRHTPAPIEIYRPGTSSKSQPSLFRPTSSPILTKRKPTFETITYEPSPPTLSAPAPTESGHKVSISKLPPPAEQPSLAPSFSKPTKPVDVETQENDFGIKPETPNTPSRARGPNPLDVINSLQEENAPAITEPALEPQASQAEPAISPSAEPNPAPPAGPAIVEPATPESAPAEPVSSPKPATPAAAKTSKPIQAAVNMEGLSFVWPIIGPTVAPFGPTSDGLHNDGINIKIRKGSPIRAAESGTVVFVGEKVKGFGQLLLIKHKNNFTTAYAHTQKILVKKKDTVKRGQVVAYSGDSGSVKFPQLHFELRNGVKPIDPTPYLAQQ